MGLSVSDSITYFAPQTRRVCTSGSKRSSSICDNEIEFVIIVSSDSVMQLVLRSHGNITAIGGMVCKCGWKASSLRLGAGILLSTELRRTPAWGFPN